ncbi:MAG: CopG family transcriptional regulator [Actinomycetota bacterium]
MPDSPKTYRTRTGKVLTDADIEAIADEAQGAQDVAALGQRRRGRPLLGASPAGVFPVRLDPGLRGAVEARARVEGTTPSEIIRRALRRYIDVA